MAPDIAMFVGVLVIKLATELTSRWGENCYLTGRAYRAAATITLVAAVSVPLGRVVIAERNNYAAAAMLVAVFVSTAWGCRDLERRRD